MPYNKLNNGLSSYHFVKKANVDKLNQVSGDITSQLLPLLDDSLNLEQSQIVIATTGSDGRYENIPGSSSLEIVSYVEGLKTSTKTVLSMALKSFLYEQNKGFSHEWKASELEIQDNTQDLLYSVDETGRRFFPTRFLDSKFLGGNYNKYKELWNVFIQQIKEKEGKSFKDLKNRIKYHQSISNTGIGEYKGNDIKHFDIENGIIYYNNERGNESGIKLGPLRYYQYKIAHLIFSAIRQNKFTEDELKELRNMDKTISVKLDLIRDKVKGFPTIEGDIKSLIDIYYSFLYIHLRMKGEFQKTGKKQILELGINEKQELKEKLEFINKYLSSMQVK